MSHDLYQIGLDIFSNVATQQGSNAREIHTEVTKLAYNDEPNGEDGLLMLWCADMKEQNLYNFRLLYKSLKTMANNSPSRQALFALTGIAGFRAKTHGPAVKNACADAALNIIKIKKYKVPKSVAIQHKLAHVLNELEI